MSIILGVCWLFFGLLHSGAYLFLLILMVFYGLKGSILVSILYILDTTLYLMCLLQILYPTHLLVLAHIPFAIQKHFSLM